MPDAAKRPSDQRARSFHAYHCRHVAASAPGADFVPPRRNRPVTAIVWTQHRRGLALVAAGTIMWSSTGLFVRMLHLDIWTILAWRSLFGAIMLIGWLLATKRRAALRAIAGLGLAGLAAVLATAISMIAFIVALSLTTVADVLMVNAALPFLAAAVALVWSGERTARGTLAAAAVALAGVLIIVEDSARSGRVLGDALALVATILFAVLIVLLRRERHLSLAAVNALAGLTCAAICFPLSGGEAVAVSDLCVLALSAFASFAFAMIVFFAGARMIPSGEAGLVSLLETFLGPLWVWLVFAETPTPQALLGGLVVLGAVVWHLVDGWWREARVLSSGA
jgi:drug/metabolite transporter (DMT)-like permease